MSPLPPDLTVKSWPDAIGVALALADEFAHLYAGLLLDPSGRVASARLKTLEATPPPESKEFIGTQPGFDDVLRWLVRQPHTWPVDRGRRKQAESSAQFIRGSVLLVSVGAVHFDVPAGDQRKLFLKAQLAAELSGYQLLDIIETDGDCLRSFAYLFDPEAPRRRA